MNKDSLVPASVTMSEFYMGSQSKSTVLLFLAIYIPAVAYCTCTCKFECKTCASRQHYLRLWVLVVWTLVWFLNWHHFVIYYGFGRLHEFLLSCKDCMFLKCQRSVLYFFFCQKQQYRKCFIIVVLWKVYMYFQSAYTWPTILCFFMCAKTALYIRRSNSRFFISDQGSYNSKREIVHICRFLVKENCRLYI